MKDIMNKMLNAIGFEVERDDDEEQEFLQEEKQVPERRSHINWVSDTRKGKIVDINATTQFKVVVLQVQKFDDVIDIADHLKAKKPVVVNMESAEKEMARRMIDFLSGVVYAIDGGIQKISAGIMLVTPYNVEILGDFQNELRSKGVFPWN